MISSSSNTGISTPDLRRPVGRGEVAVGVGSILGLYVGFAAVIARGWSGMPAIGMTVVGALVVFCWYWRHRTVANRHAETQVEYYAWIVSVVLYVVIPGITAVQGVTSHPILAGLLAPVIPTLTFITYLALRWRTAP